MESPSPAQRVGHDWNSRAPAGRLTDNLGPNRPPKTALRLVEGGILVPLAIALYVFIFYSRIFDVTSLWRLHIPMILLFALVLTALIRGNMGRLFRSRTSRAIMALTGWVCICLPFSAWPGGSVESVKLALQSFAVFLVMIALLRSFESWLKVAYAMGFAVTAAACLSFFIGKSVQGRYAFAEGTNADPNQFALMLLMGLPFLWLLAKQSPGLSVSRIFALLCTIPVLVAFFRAGSRAGLLCLLSMAGVMFLQATAIQKLKLVVLGIVVAGCAFFLLPSYLRVRFFTLFSTSAVAAEELDDQSLQYMGGDIGSSHGRRQLLKDGLMLTINHPVFGVGPGQFAHRNWEEARKKGERRASVVNHNTYLQYSSETGVPGLLSYVMVLLYAFFDLRRVSKEAKARVATHHYYQQIVTASQYLTASVVSFVLGSFFLSLAYSIVVYSMMGLVASFCMSARAMMSLNDGRIPAPAPAAASQRFPSQLRPASL
ncbi:MAG: O-antigen ligase family protein [Bryobacterales bacterium]|nr:O-antigen ligase family protein [Bryobacterales bacterium]